jgi:hypothetical protein
MQSSLKMQLSAGTYYVVSEGYGTNSGDITTIIGAVAGANMSNAIDAGNLTSAFTDTRSNATANGYGNDYGQPSDDIYYTFTLTSSSEVEISHCASGFDTYLHLLDASGNSVASNDDNGPLCSALQASLQIQLAPGTYYVVSEGYNTNYGDITTQISAIVVNNSSGYQLATDSMLQYLDKSPITTGLLYDRVFQDARLDIFNYYQTDTSSYTHFLQANYELYSAAYNPTGLLTRSGLENLIANNSASSVVPIGILHFDFNYIDSAAVTNNLIYQSGNLFYDVPGRPASPYKQRRLLLAAALTAGSETSQLKFKLDPALFFTNTGTTVNYVSIDFGNGAGAATYYPGTSLININYPSAGVKTIRYTVNYGNNQQVTTASAFLVKNFTGSTNTRITSEFDPCYRPAIDVTPPQYLEADIAFTGYGEGESRKGLGDVNYYYSTKPTSAKVCDGTQKNVTMPIILLDGIDHNDERSAANIYAEYLIYKNASQEDANLGHELRALGYDLVILNFPNIDIDPSPSKTKLSQSGVDWIERNAFVLIKLIKQLNAQKAAAGSTEKNIVVGPSMGGQISRYALAYMEKKLAETGLAEWDHQTRLWISLDSPHLGANVPIGVQHFVRYYAEEAGQGSAIKSLEYINSPASREMTIHHNTAGETPAPAAVRANYLAALAEVGNYPIRLRKIAIANGSQTGALQHDLNTLATFSPKQQMYLLEYRGGFYQGSAENPLFNPIAFFGRYIVTSKARVYFTPSYGERSVIMDGKIGTKKRIRYAQAPAYSCSYDVGPGGSFDIQADVAMNDNSLYYRTKYFSVTHGASFIPVFSSLGYTKTNPDLCENLSGKNLVSTCETPFDAYYAQADNQEHIFLSAANVAFIKDEINNPQPGRSMVGATYEITGPTTVCANQTATYSVPTQGAGAIYNWTVQNFNIISGQNTNTIQVQGPAGSSGNRSVGLNVTTSCYTYQPPQLTVTNTSSSNSFYISGPSSLCPGQLGYFSINTSATDITSYEWIWPSDWTYFGGQNTPNLDVRAPYGSFGSKQIVLRVGNSCGLSEPVVQYVMENTSGCYEGYTYAVSPNPTDDYVEVKATKKDKEGKDIKLNESDYEKMKDVEVKIYDKYSKELKTGKLKDGRLHLDVHLLANDIYFIHIISGKEIIREKIIVAN